MKFKDFLVYETQMVPMSVLKETITVKDIYLTNDPQPPAGFEFTGEFRVVQEGDTFSGKIDHEWNSKPYPMTAYPGSTMPWRGPRLILREIPKTKKVRHIYEQVEDGPRKIKLGEFFCSVDPEENFGARLNSPGSKVLNNSGVSSHSSVNDTRFIPLVYRREEY